MSKAKSKTSNDKYIARPISEMHKVRSPQRKQGNLKGLTALR
jgi:hypothetical protein